MIKISFSYHNTYTAILPPTQEESVRKYQAQYGVSIEEAITEVIFHRLGTWNTNYRLIKATPPMLDNILVDKE